MAEELYVEPCMYLIFLREGRGEKISSGNVRIGWKGMTGWLDDWNQMFYSVLLWWDRGWGRSRRGRRRAELGMAFEIYYALGSDGDELSMAIGRVVG